MLTDPQTAPKALLAAAMAHCPLVAILRGVRPDEVVAITDGLVEAGFALIEVPLNSPDPLASIAALAGRYPAPVLIGAGTVLTVAEAHAVRDAGGQLAISPNTNPAVIAASVAAGMVAMPGFFTPSEGFAAAAAGAHALKLFPAEAASPAILRAQLAVLPLQLPLLAVGGITPETLRPWLNAGAAGAGIASALYRKGDGAAKVAAAAARFIAALQA